MTNYIIFVSAPYNPHRTYFQCQRRGEKGIDVIGNRADMLAKVAELKSNGEHIISVCTSLGTPVHI